MDQQEQAKKHLQQIKLIYQLLLDKCFLQQKNFILDTAKRKALFVARRSGKSYALALYLLLLALTHPRVKCLYFGLYKETAKNTLWTNTLEQICLDLNIRYHWKSSSGVLTFPNGSIIVLTGADARPQEIKKWLGGKYFIAVIDECQDQTQDLKSIIFKDLGPAVKDYLPKGGGIICLAGTPGDKLRDDTGNEHYWYQVTKKPESIRAKGWSVHSWDRTDNPHIAEADKLELQEIINTYGDGYVETSWFKQQYLCEWVIINSFLVYDKFSDTKNTLNPNLQEDQILIHSLLTREPGWKYILSLDVGWQDDMAWVIGAFRKHDPIFYIVESFKQNKMLLDEIVYRTQMYQTKYRPISMIIDSNNSAKLVEMTLRGTYKLPFKGVVKPGEKSFRINRFNSDLLCGMVKLIKDTNIPLIEEWQTLPWDPKRRAEGKFEEDDKYPNHLADAALYCYFESLHSIQKPEQKLPQDSFLNQVLEKRKAERSLHKNEYDYYDRLQQQEDDKNLVSMLIDERYGAKWPPT